LGDRADLRAENESLRERLKAAEREARQLSEQVADAERRAQFAQEVLLEERRQYERERVNLEKLIKALGGNIEQPGPPPRDPEPRPEKPAETDAPTNGNAAPVLDDAEAYPEPEQDEPLVEEERPSALTRLIGRRQRPGVPRKCSVCGRRIKSLDLDELEAEGWAVTGRVAVCGTCTADGWELEKEALLPFRRASQKDAQAAE